MEENKSKENMEEERTQPSLCTASSPEIPVVLKLEWKGKNKQASLCVFIGNTRIEDLARKSDKQKMMNFYLQLYLLIFRPF